MVASIVTSMMTDNEIVQDLVQEIILHAYLSLDHLRDFTRFKSWLYGIALNICRSHIRSQRTSIISLEALIGGVRGDPSTLPETLTAVDPQVIAEEHDLHQRVLHAVYSLPSKDRVATLMFYYQQLRLDEIAAILGISVVAVKGRLYRSRKQLREILASTFAEEMAVTGITQRSEKVIRVHINSVYENTTTKQYVVTLQDESGRRILHIWIGQIEALTITMGLARTPVPRPLTAHLMVTMLQATGAQLEEVRIETLKDEVFYATVKIRKGKRVQEIDARPSDALSLAVLTECPLYVSEDVMKHVGVEIPEGKSLQTRGYIENSARGTVWHQVTGSIASFTTKKADVEVEAFQKAQQQLFTLLTQEAPQAG